MPNRDSHFKKKEKHENNHLNMRLKKSSWRKKCLKNQNSPLSEECQRDSHEKISHLKFTGKNSSRKKSHKNSKIAIISHMPLKFTITGMKTWNNVPWKAPFLQSSFFVKEKSNFQKKFLQIAFIFIWKSILLKIRYSEVLSNLIVRIPIDFHVKADLTYPDFSGFGSGSWVIGHARKKSGSWGSWYLKHPETEV